MAIDQQVSFVTWNVGGFLFSAQAPASWTHHDQQTAVNDALAEADADVIALQEVPSRDRTPMLADYEAAPGVAESHAGAVTTLVGRSVATADQPVRVVEGCAVMVTLACGLTVANVHLAPFKASAAFRLQQLATIVGASPTDALLVIGDTNTTLGEMKAIETLGLTGDKPPEFTVNWRRNRFHPDERGPRITTYYTRWLATAAVTVSDVEVWSSPVEAEAGERFHLSDHFALSGTATVAGSG